MGDLFSRDLHDLSSFMIDRPSWVCKFESGIPYHAVHTPYDATNFCL